MPSVVSCDPQRLGSRLSGRAPEEEKPRGPAAFVVKLLSMIRNGGMSQLNGGPGCGRLLFFKRASSCYGRDVDVG